MHPHDHHDIWLASHAFAAGILFATASLGVWMLFAEATGM